MMRIGGELDPETGECVMTAVRARVDAELRSGPPGERRTPAPRRADALGEICRRWLDSADRPRVAGERPHVTVTVDLEALGGRGEGRSELDHTGPVPAELARRIACDAGVHRVITRGSSEPLDVGRRTPVVPAALRRAVVARDRGCRFPGCDRPAPWCECHHARHWADGGETKLSNLLLLCGHHHRSVHEEGFGVRMEEDLVVFTRPDGGVLGRHRRSAGRAPP